MINRRAFLSALGLLAAPLGAEAQEPGRVRRIGILGTNPPDASNSFPAFRKALQELGYVEGQHVRLEYRWPETGREGYPALAAQLVQNRFARPGGNATGTVVLSRELEAKRLELLKEAVPGLSRAVAMWKANSPTHPRTLQDLQEAGRHLSVRVIPLEWTGPGDIEKLFQLARREQAGGVLALPGPDTWRAREEIARAALKHRLPAVGSEPSFAAVGNLVQYGPDLPESCRRAAGYVDRILKSAKPGDLPVEQPTKFELVINLKTAKALGLTIPPSLLQRADQVIE